MSVPGRRPHLLIDCDPILTGTLWRGCADADKPFVLCGNEMARSIGDPVTDQQEHFRIGTSLDGLIEESLHIRRDPSVLADFWGEMRVVRRHFRLAPGEKIRIAMVGSHSSMSANVDASMTHHAHNAKRSKRSGIEDGMRRGRMLAGLVDATFRKLRAFEPVWLADAFTGLRPRLRPSAYDMLAEIARARVATMRLPPYGELKKRLRQPAVPLIYVANGKDGAWREMEPHQRARPYSTTQKLIEQFGALRAQDASLRGVLLKVVPGDAGRHNILDAPMVGESTLDLAHDHQLEAIILDARYGVLRRTDFCQVNERLVYGSLASGTILP